MNIKAGYKKQTFDSIEMIGTNVLLANLTSAYKIHKLVTAFNVSCLKSCEGPSGSTPLKTYYYKSI